MSLLLLLACGGPDPVDAPAGTDLPFTWADGVLADPASFTARLDADGRDGWIALHAGRPEHAARAFTGPDGQARAAAELARVHRALGRAHRGSALALAEEWDVQTGAPEPVLAVAARARECDAVRADVVDGRPSLPEGPAWQAPGPGFTRALYDPCRDLALAQAWAERSVPLEGLPAELFAGSPALLPPLPASDDIQTARDHAAGLEAAVDALKARSRTDHLGADAASLRDELLVYERMGVETAIFAAERALDAGYPQYARTLLLLAEQPSADGVSPRNPPALYAWLAVAELESGRPREALDRLARLELDGVPDIAGPRETIGDLAVLRGLARGSDSREP